MNENLESLTFQRSIVAFTQKHGHSGILSSIGRCGFPRFSSIAFHFGVIVTDGEGIPCLLRCDVLTYLRLLSVLTQTQTAFQEPGGIHCFLVYVESACKTQHLFMSPCLKT